MGIFNKLFKKKDSAFESELSKDLKMDDFDKELGLGPEPGFGASGKKQPGFDDIGPGGINDLGPEPAFNDSFEPEPKKVDLRQPMQQQPQPLPQQYYPQQQAPMHMQMPISPPSDRDVIMNKNMEVIASKLDALRMSMESISQRLANLEKIASDAQQTSQQGKERYRW